MKTASFNPANLLWPISLMAFFLLAGCYTSSREKANTVKEKQVQEQPRPVMESQTDSLKKMLDEKRKSRH
jgi:hypothetical protein